VGILQEACTHAGVPAVSLWAAVPHYVSQPPNPKATLALLNRLEDLIDVRIPMGELPEDARAWQTGVDELASEDSEVAEYVQTLEEARDTAELPEASGEAIAREFEKYLRRRDGHGSHAREGGEPGDGRDSGPYLRDLSGQQGGPSREERRGERPEESGGPEEKTEPEGTAGPHESGGPEGKPDTGGDGSTGDAAPNDDPHGGSSHGDDSDGDTKGQDGGSGS
jgi:hypothetical protein